mgnify:CR=1 FL=1
MFTYNCHLRQEVTSNWDYYSFILENGELVVVKDDNARFLVIGDGISSFKDLPRIRLEIALNQELCLIMRDGKPTLNIIECKR